MKRMTFMRKMIAMMAMAFSVAMFASCSDDDDNGPGTDPVNPGGDSTTIVKVTGVTLNAETLDLVLGMTDTLVATVTPEDATDLTVAWESSNPELVSVDSVGIVTAIATTEEPVTITVTTNDGGFTATCAVTVAEPALQVGDFVYADGTTSSHTSPVIEDPNNPVWGVVYYVFEEGESPQDGGLISDYPDIKEWKGLALQISANYTTRWSEYFQNYATDVLYAQGTISSYETNILFDYWLPNYATKNYPQEIGSRDLMNGYSNTQIYRDFNDNSKWTVTFMESVDKREPQPVEYPVYINVVNAFALEFGGRSPKTQNWGSDFYIPSALEWEEIGKNLAVINESLTAAGGVALETEWTPQWACAYWTSTAAKDDLASQYYFNDTAYAFDASTSSISAISNNERNARIAFAF